MFAKLKTFLVSFLAALLALGVLHVMTPAPVEAKGWAVGGPVRPMPIAMMGPRIFPAYPLGPGSLQASPGLCNDTFKINHTPAAAAQATISKAALAGVSN